MATFKRLLQKRTDFSLHGIFEDKGLKEVAEIYRKQFGGNPFGINPDQKPLIPCSMDKNCTATYNPNTKLWSSGCTGYCCGD